MFDQITIEDFADLLFSTVVSRQHGFGEVLLQHFRALVVDMELHIYNMTSISITSRYIVWIEVSIFFVFTVEIAVGLQ